MAKITVNTLPSATTPLAGTEELLVVQSGVDKKVVTAQLVRQGVSETVTGVKTFASPPAVPSPSGADDATPKSYVDGVAAGAPIGSMLMWAAAAAPTGYLLCDGSAVDRTTYADLFVALGTTWGSGDGSTTFNIPDMRGAAPAGVGTSTGYTQNETLALGTKYNDQMHGHRHPGGLVVNAGSITTIGPVRTISSVAARLTTEGTASTSEIVASDSITDGTNGTPRTGNVTRGKRVGVNFIIKAL